MFSSGPKYQKLTTNLRLVINRLKLLEKKKTEQAVKARKEIADYLTAGKPERARIRVEHIIREDYLVEAMELVEMYCDLVVARMGLLQSSKELDEGLEEPIATIIWATPRLQAEAKELQVVTEQFTAKFGKEFTQACRANQLNNVNEKVMHKLSVQAPPRLLVDKYLEEIARTYGAPFTPELSPVDEVAMAEGLLIEFTDKRFGPGGPGGSSGGGGSGGGGLPAMDPRAGPPHNPGYAYPPTQPAGAAGPPQHAPAFTPPGAAPPGAPGHIGFQPPPGPSNYPPGPGPSNYPPGPGPSNYPPGPGPTNYPPGPNPYPPPNNGPGAPPAKNIDDMLPNLPSVPGGSIAPGGASAGGENVDFDDLSRRFEELKRKK